MPRPLSGKAFARVHRRVIVEHGRRLRELGLRHPLITSTGRPENDLGVRPETAPRISIASLTVIATPPPN